MYRSHVKTTFAMWNVDFDVFVGCFLHVHVLQVLDRLSQAVLSHTKPPVSVFVKDVRHKIPV